VWRGLGARPQGFQSQHKFCRIRLAKANDVTITSSVSWAAEVRTYAAVPRQLVKNILLLRHESGNQPHCRAMRFIPSKAFIPEVMTKAKLEESARNSYGTLAFFGKSYALADRSARLVKILTVDLSYSATCFYRY
jgi:hypothetical protein